MGETKPQSDGPSCGAGCATIGFIALLIGITVAIFYKPTAEDMQKWVPSNDEEKRRKHDEETRPAPIVPIVVPKRSDP